MTTRAHRPIHRSAHIEFGIALAIALLAAPCAATAQSNVGEAEQIAIKARWIQEHGAATGGGEDGGGDIRTICAGDSSALMFPFNIDDPEGDGWIMLPPGDDNSSALIPLPFTFNLFGKRYTGCYINTNGNITFGAPSFEFFPTDFPSNGPPRIAPFWADVDTREQGTATGLIWYKFFGNTLVVTWDNVGFFNLHSDRMNAFQVAISDGSDDRFGRNCQNVCFSYSTLCWTTGDINGVGGFGEPPATVGIDCGNGVDAIQIGRFNRLGMDYDGPYGEPDGVEFLENRDICLDVSRAVDRGVGAGRKGSVLILPKVELRWKDLDAPGSPGFGIVESDELIQDTFVSVTNDSSELISIKMYLVNGDPDFDEPGVRFHDGWSFVDDTLALTPNHPVYWSLFSGAPGSIVHPPFDTIQPYPFTDPDDGTNPGYPDRLRPGSGERVLRGFVVIWATDANERPICWNHLTGKVTVVNYALGQAYEYLPFVAQGLCETCGDGESPEIPWANGAIALDGVRYSAAPDRLELDFFADPFGATSNGALSGPGVTTSTQTELTLLPLAMDFTERTPPATTLVLYTVHNENEQRRSFPATHCVTCWDSRFLNQIANQFGRAALGTNAGKAVLDTQAGSTFCRGVDGEPTVTIAPGLVGVETLWLSFPAARMTLSASGLTPVGKDPISSAINFADQTGQGALKPIAPSEEDQPGLAKRAERRSDGDRIGDQEQQVDVRGGP